MLRDSDYHTNQRNNRRLPDWSDYRSKRNTQIVSSGAGEFMALGRQLTAAREQSGFSQDDLAAAMGVSRAMISYWESGKRTPNDRQLTALARLLRVDVSDLLTDEPIDTADIAHMLFRGADHQLPPAALSGLQEFEHFLDDYARLAQVMGVELRGLKQTPFVTSPGYQSQEDARRKAEEVRAHLRLGLGPIGDIDWVCELLGITVFRAALGSDLRTTISGAFFNHAKVGFAILVNLDMTPGRRRFTIAHELAHALYHSDKVPYVLSYARKDPQEHFADAFAGELLMPAEGIRRVMEEQGIGPRIGSPADVIHLQRFFRVSYVTALVRLRRARILSELDFQRFKFVRPVLSARALGYEVDEEEFVQDPDVWRIQRFPHRFLSLLRSSVQSETISASTAANMTGLSLDEITALATDRLGGSEDEAREELEQFEVTGVSGAH